MADFLLVLGKANLAMGAAILLVWLLRRPLRAQFGAPIAYALWLLVPVAGLAMLLPPRTEAPVAHVARVEYPVAQISAAQNPVAQYPATQNPSAQMPDTMPAAPTPRIAEQPPAASARSMIAAEMASLGSFDYVPPLFGAWVLGAVLMAFYLAQLQVRFHATMRLGEAGPAVLGFFRPRVVMPDSFQEQFTAAEQAAILAHERVHLARQDARINALAALLRCLCWFNPLVHLGAASMRMDQELACDATALAGAVSRRDYANALLKSQMMTTLLPLGCNWPGSQHPLIERIALLKRKPPGTARRNTGAGLVMVAATFAGLGAWAAQPAVAAKVTAAPHVSNQIALAKLPARSAVANQNAGDVSQPVADANPIPGEAVKNIPITKTAAQPRVNAPMPDGGRAETQSLPLQDSLPEQVDLALNATADTALAKTAADAAGALSKDAAAREMAVRGEQSSAKTLQHAADTVTAGGSGAATETSQALQVAPDQHIGWVGMRAGLSPRGDVRPEVAQPLKQAVQLAKAIHPDPEAIIEKFNQAAAVPNLNRDEENTLGQARSLLFGGRPSNSGNNNSYKNGNPWYGSNDLLSPLSETPTMGPGPWTPN